MKPCLLQVNFTSFRGQYQGQGPSKFSLHLPFEKILFIFYFWLQWVLLCPGFFQLWQAGATLYCVVRGFYCRGFPCCRARATVHGIQQSWATGLAAPWYMGSSRTRDQTYDPCIGRWILNPWTTREVTPSLSVSGSLGVHLSLFHRLFPPSFDSKPLEEARKRDTNTVY